MEKVLALTGSEASQERDSSARDLRRARLVALLAILLPLIGFWGLMLATNPYVPPGHEGYVYERPRILGEGGFRGTVTGPGNYGLSFFRNEGIVIDMRPITYTEEFKILAKDDLNISFRFHAVLALEPGSVVRVVDELGGLAWYERFVQESLRTYVRDAAQRFAGTEVKNMRASVTQEVTERLSGYLEAVPIELLSLVVGDIDYPEEVTRAVDRKLAAEQLLEEKATQMEIARKDAEIRIEEAKGQAEAQKIIDATLTDRYLQYQAIIAQIKMAESPAHSTIYIPTGSTGIPLVQDLNRSAGSRQRQEP